MNTGKRSEAFNAASNKWAKRQRFSGDANERGKDLDVILVHSDDEADLRPSPLSPLLLLQNSSMSADTPNTVTMDSLMGAPDINATWQFNFNVEIELALSYLHPNVSKFGKEVIFVVGSSVFRDQADLALKGRYNLRQHIAPLPNKFASHHTKMMVNFYPQAVEIVIMSCNLTKLDIAALTQTVWRSGRLPRTEAQSSSSFKRELQMYLKRYHLPAIDALALQLDSYDFGGVTAELISSAPGVYDMDNPGESNGLCGYGRLYEVLRDSHLLTSDTPGAHTNFLAQATSIAYPYTFAKGEVSSIFTHLLCPLVFSRCFEDFKLLKPGSSSCQLHQKHNNYSPHLIYPTSREVAQSLLGFGSGQALHFDYTKSAIHKAHYLQAIKPFLRKYTSVHSGARGRDIMMPHLKVLLCDNADDWKTIKWVYFGSHNLSKQAWGAPLRYKNCDPRIYRVDSYELGVLVTPPKGQRYIPATIIQPGKGKVETDIEITLPFPVPPANYELGDQPWSMHQSYPGIFDRLGQEYIIEQK